MNATLKPAAANPDYRVADLKLEKRGESVATAGPEQPPA